MKTIGWILAALVMALNYTLIAENYELRRRLFAIARGAEVFVASPLMRETEDAEVGFIERGGHVYAVAKLRVNFDPIVKKWVP